MNEFDVLVIGGGINGLGIAADAAARGLSVCIVEKDDWGSGTTSASSRLIHGGLRYLQYGEIDLVRESLRERGILTRQRPHLVHPISLLIPAFKESPLPSWMVGLGLGMYHLLAHDPLFPPPSMLSRSLTRSREPFLTDDGLTGGFTYPDAQMEFPERFCVELVQETVAAGGTVRSHTRLTELIVHANQVIGAGLVDEITGEETEIRARMTINAAGPWLDTINRTLGILAPPRLIGGTWGTHIILPVREFGTVGPIYATARKDGRPFFLLPWDNRVLVGTTDVKFTGETPDSLEVEPWELDYLLSETNLLFPRAGYDKSDIEATTIGVRPLPASDKNAGAITRRHFLVDHSAKHGIHGIASIVGGKLTTYRSLAEEVTDWIIARLQLRPVHSSTAVIPSDILPPDLLLAETIRALRLLQLPDALAPALVKRYGPAAADVLGYVTRDRTLGRPLTPEGIEIEAQVVHAAKEEFARTIDDVVRRRLMLVPASEATINAVKWVSNERKLALVG